ncbi:hypothetical protein LXL04_034068 [Taraxacum kok-saghyz]
MGCGVSNSRSGKRLVCIWALSSSGFSIWRQLQTPQFDAVGSTVVLAVVTPEKIVISDCGYSRVELCRNGVAIPFYVVHKIHGLHGFRKSAKEEKEEERKSVTRWRNEKIFQRWYNVAIDNFCFPTKEPKRSSSSYYSEDELFSPKQYGSKKSSPILNLKWVPKSSITNVKMELQI